MIVAEDEARRLYRRLLESWNTRDAAAFAACFADDGTMIGFDATLAEGRASVEASLEPVFRDHPTARLVAIERGCSVRHGVALLRADAGMVRPGESRINAPTNTRHVMVVAPTPAGLGVILFQNTPIRLDWDTAERDRITAELQSAFDRGGVLQ